MGTFSLSSCGADIEKPSDASHSWRRTRAYGIDEGGCWFGVPRRRALGHGPLFLQQVGRQCNPGKEPHQYRRGAGDGPVGPLTLGFHSQMRPHFLEGDLQLPAQHKPFQDLCRSHCRFGTEQRLGVEFAFGVSNQYPTNGHGWFAGVIPERRLRGEFRPADSTVIPSHRGGIPGDSRQAKLLCPKLLFQSGQTHALHPGPAFLARQPGRRRSIETGIQPQPGDSTW